MTNTRFPEVVLIARRGKLEKACALLARHGIGSRHSRPRRSDGILRVADADAAKAREVLHEAGFDHDAVVLASEAAWFRCHSCRTPLSLGTKLCPTCNAIVGDFHGS